MGLDIQFARTKYDYGFRAGSYSGFNVFRTVLAKEENIDLAEMQGFGEGEGTKLWKHTTTSLVPFLYHSDCEGIINPLDARRMLPRFREIATKWENGEFVAENLDDEDKQYYVELIGRWIGAFERIKDAYENEIDEHIVFC